jgi:hypothetical protein
MKTTRQVNSLIAAFCRGIKQPVGTLGKTRLDTSAIVTVNITPLDIAIAAHTTRQNFLIAAA